MDDILDRVIKLEKQMASLQKSFLQAQANQVPITGKTDSAISTADSAINMAESLTPYTETKTAYIGDTEVEFEPSKDGNVSVFFDKNVGNYRFVKDYYTRRMIVIFDDPLEEVTEVTISIS